MKGRNFIIKGTVYPFDIMVSHNQTETQLKKELKKYKIPYDEILNMAETAIGRAVMLDTNQIIIRFRGELTEGVIAHEAFHATSMLLSRIGVQLEIGISDEAYAYLLQYIVNEISNELF